MIRLFANANYDFIGFRRIAYILTALIIIPGILMIAVTGLNYSIEFTGGTVVQVLAKRPVDVAEVRAAIEAGGVKQPEITSFRGTNEFVVRARLGNVAATDEHTAQRTADSVTAALDRHFGAGTFTLRHREIIGPKVGGELRTKAILARKDGRQLRRMTIYLPTELARRLAIYAAGADMDVSGALAEIVASFLEGKTS